MTLDVLDNAWPLWTPSQGTAEPVLHVGHLHLGPGAGQVGLACGDGVDDGLVLDTVRSVAPSWVSPRQMRARVDGPDRPSISEYSTGCGCIRGIRIPAASVRCLSRPLAACRSIRSPSVLHRIGPFSRLSTARSIARATAGGNGTRTTLPPFPRTSPR
jgi:hypothetical protein